MKPANLALCVLTFIVLGLGLAWGGVDRDGDGVEDGRDDCSNTPLGTLVDQFGRPLGDLDGDCDADLADFELFSSSFTGSLPPYSIEVCDDLLDNDLDDLVDCADVQDCPTGTVCGPGVHCSQFAGCGCPAGLGDCNGVPTDGCETALNADPVCSSSFQYLGALNGDTGAQFTSFTGSGESFFAVTLAEDSDLQAYLSATVQLTSATGTDYDLYLRCASCGGAITSASTSSGPHDFVYPRWEDDFGQEDTYDIIIEVRWSSGGCGDWTLNIFGNTNLDGFPNTCNP